MDNIPLGQKQETRQRQTNILDYLVIISTESNTELDKETRRFLDT